MKAHSEQPGSLRLAATPTHELKFVFPNLQAATLVRWLQGRCPADPQHATGIVSSIYYETPDWHCLREKTNSDFLKTKVRLRWYGDLETGEPDEAAFLEVKFKIGGRREKFRAPVDWPGSRLATAPLHAPFLAGITPILQAAGIPFRQPLLPMLQVTYCRRRFVDAVTGARLCVDYDIQMPRVNRTLLASTGTFALAEGVFECKSPHPELPVHLQQMTALGCRKQAFSKYEQCFAKALRVRP